jgi:hypothetical protein
MSLSGACPPLLDGGNNSVKSLLLFVDGLGYARHFGEELRKTKRLINEA